MNKIHMTENGYAQLLEELEYKKSVKRPNIIKAIAEARAHGDLSENAEYKAAKEDQSLNEGRIVELESKIGRAEVHNPSKLSGNIIQFGATVRLENESENGKLERYQIVGEDEAMGLWEKEKQKNAEKSKPDKQEDKINLDQKKSEVLKISSSSPIARAISRKSEGDTVVVNLPHNNTKEYTIQKIEYI